MNNDEKDRLSFSFRLEQDIINETNPNCLVTGGATVAGIGKFIFDGFIYDYVFCAKFTTTFWNPETVKRLLHNFGVWRATNL